MHQTLHPRDDKERLYVLRKERRELSIVKDCMDTSKQVLEEYIKTS